MDVECVCVCVFQENPQTSRCLGVFGLSLYTQERDLRELFEQYGPVAEIQIVYDHQTGRSRGFAFVYMRNHDDAIEVSYCCCCCWDLLFNSLFSLRTGFPQILQSPGIFCLSFSRPVNFLTTRQVLESPWISSLVEVLEILTNVTTARKGWKHYCRFCENYTDDVQEYTKYIDEVVAEQRSRFLFFMPGDRINTLFYDSVAGCKHFTEVWSDIRRIMSGICCPFL